MNEKEVDIRLEEALLSFIERTLEKKSPEPYELQVIPAMGDVLCKLWCRN